MARSVTLGLGGARPVREDAQETRLPERESADIVNLKAIAAEVHRVADGIMPDEPEGKKPSFLRGDFDANLAEDLEIWDLNKIGMDLLRGIQADLDSRKDWEAMVERAIRFLGLIYEEASGEMASEGSISKAWHTLMLEASINFWANAHAEFLPADGPVKVRDDEPAATTPGIGDNGGPPLDDQSAPPPGPSAGLPDDMGLGLATASAPSRTELAEAFELDFNHYLTVRDKQYYRDFSRMLWSLGPKGTEFRKVYRNPLRGNMPISEWVKSENLIVSNDEADLSTAGRVTERIMMRQADVKRMQWKDFWIDEALTQPTDQPTAIEEQIGRVEGIRRRIEIPADQLHTIYECCCELDLPGFEHEEDGEITGLPLPYIVTIDKDSRKVLAIRRNWKEGDEDFARHQRYVMFGLLPGFGLYFLGFVHILGNTERALTAMEREVIDNTMMAIFPGWFAAKGAFSRGDTQVRVGPGGVREVDLGMGKSINDVVKPIEVAQIGSAHVALFEKLEDNGRKLAQTLELPIGEGTADIPVGTMIALIEQKTKVMAAVHKGIHAARAEELGLLRDLIADDPGVLQKGAPSKTRWEEMVDEFEDFDLVPSSDPNTPSHIHRVMKAVGLGQVAQMFPDLADRKEVFKELLAVLQIANPARFLSKNPQQQPDPKQVAGQQKLAVAQLNAGVKDRDTQARAKTAIFAAQGKLEEAKVDQQTEAMKTKAQLVGDQMRQHDSAQEQAIDAQGERAHDMAMQQREHEHQRQQAAQQAMFPHASPKRSF